MYHYKDCGLDYIYLLNGYEVINDPEFGECISIHDIEGLHRQIAKNIVSKAPSIRGQEVRFFRSEFKLTQTQMATLLGTDLRTIQRWEIDKKSDPIPLTADRLVRLFYTAYTEKGHQVIKETCKLIEEAHNSDCKKKPFKHVTFSNAFTIQFSDTSKGWKSKIAA